MIGFVTTKQMHAVVHTSHYGARIDVPALCRMLADEACVETDDLRLFVVHDSGSVEILRHSNNGDYDDGVGDATTSWNDQSVVARYHSGDYCLHWGLSHHTLDHDLGAAALGLEIALQRGSSQTVAAPKQQQQQQQYDHLHQYIADSLGGDGGVAHHVHDQSSSTELFDCANCRVFHSPMYDAVGDGSVADVPGMSASCYITPQVCPDVARRCTQPLLFRLVADNDHVSHTLTLLVCECVAYTAHTSQGIFNVESALSWLTEFCGNGDLALRVLKEGIHRRWICAVEPAALQGVSRA